MAASAVAALCGCLAAAGCGKQVDGAEPTLNYAFCMTERSQPQLFLEEKWVLGRRSWNIFARPLERTSKEGRTYGILLTSSISFRPEPHLPRL